MDNLRSQLGLTKSISESDTFFANSLTRFPLFKRTLHRILWGNRNHRHVQTRLLWELQNHFRGLIPHNGVSPERPEVIILCFLSFPAIDFVVDEDAGDGQLHTKHTAHGVNIAIHPLKQDYKIHLSIPLGPQEVHIVVQIELLPPMGVEVTAILRREGTFLWQSWSIDLATRLEEWRRLQEHDGLEFCEVTQTHESITQGMASAALMAFGTGQNMRVWRGWLPHRPGMCLFEVESDGFIIQLKKEQLDLKFSMHLL